MGSRTAFAMVGWLAAAAAATVVGLGAVRVIGAGITGTAAATLTQEEVAEALASPVPTSAPGPAASPSPRPEPSATIPAGTLLTPTGGQVKAYCADGLVTLEWWAPASGYRVTDYDRGPTDEAEITFERGGKGHGNGEVEVHIACAGDTPQIVRVDDD
ncbi:septum formation initiator [Phytohabitans kaempferiae]|uniref:Septum formation initiator n=1 Tax=Phytohabitans kaempferiae TaxID=1620943 RepID=A0ABV6M2X5_9ACTN